MSSLASSSRSTCERLVLSIVAILFFEIFFSFMACASCQATTFSQSRTGSCPAGVRKIRAEFSALVCPLASCTLYNMERIGRLPKTKQRFVMEMLDTVLAQASQ